MRNMNEATPVLDHREQLLNRLLMAEQKRQQANLKIVPRRPGHDPVPLSYAQERLWFLDQVGFVGAAYNAPMSLRLVGELAEAALEASFVELVRRHESLRTCFEAVDGEPHQVVDAQGRFDLHREDFSALEGNERERRVRERVEQEHRQKFNLRTGPLLRVSLIKLQEREHVLLVTRHHIVSDGWSVGVLLREFGALYHAYVQNRPSPLPALEVQYADYALWQRQLLCGELLERHLAYWKKQLLGAPPQLELPTDRPRPQVESFRGAMLTFEIPNTLSQALEEVARRAEATLFMVLLTAFQILLSRWSGQRDVVVGTPVAGRNNRQVEDLIGFFVNTLALRTEIVDDLTFGALLARVKEVTLGAYAHQDLPFELLVKELRPERDLSRQPIVQVVMALQNYPEEQLHLPGITATWIEDERVSTHFDLTLHLNRHANGISGIVEYATDLFDGRTIERMATRLRMVLEGVVAHPHRPVGQLSLISIEEQRLLTQWNATTTNYPQEALIHQLFEDQVKRIPQATALVCGAVQLTYAELNRRANALAQVLRAHGVGPDGRVALFAERSVEIVVGMLAVLKAGGAYVPIDVSYPPQRVAYMLQDCAPLAVLTQSHLSRRLPAMGAPIVLLEDALLDQDADDDANLDVKSLGLESRHLAYIIYTSGSTGTPKGVMVEHRSVVNLIHWHCGAFDVCEGARTSSVAAVGFDAAVWEIWPPLTAGATLVLAPAEVAGNVDALLSWWASERLDVSFLPTPMAEAAFAQGITNTNLRTLLVGGDGLNHRPGQASFALVNNYGPTEVTVLATSGRIRDEDPVLHIGRPVANTRIHILDRHGAPAPIGVAGEIYVGGVGVARGYLNRPEQQAQRFVRDPFTSDPQARMYRTGDVGRWRADGTIEFLGRNDEQVKIRGFRIELGEVAARLGTHPEVGESVVVAREDVPGEKYLVAYFTPHATANSTAAALRAYLSTVLPDYMVPTAFVRLERLPLTANGKLDRAALPAPELDAYVSRAYEAPLGDVERALAEVWQGLLRIEKVGRQDNFFELGGHSLHGMRLAAKVSERFGVPLSAAAVFQHPTVRQMAQAVEALQSYAAEQEEGVL